jgi:hypothetical protein
MDDDFQQSPRISVERMRAELVLSKHQAAAGQGRPLADVIAQMKAAFSKGFSNSVRLENTETDRRKIG